MCGEPGARRCLWVRLRGSGSRIAECRQGGACCDRTDRRVVRRHEVVLEGVPVLKFAICTRTMVVVIGVDLLGSSVSQAGGTPTCILSGDRATQPVGSD